MYKYNITNHDIKNIPKIKSKYITDYEAQSIRLFSSILLSVSMFSNNSDEIGLLYDVTNYENYKWFYGVTNHISLTQYDRKILFRSIDKNLWNRYIFIHNHPNNTKFSYNDIKTFLYSSTVYICIVVQNNGILHILRKNKNTTDYDVKFFENNFTSVIEYLKYINKDSTVGIKYIVRR